LNSFFNVFLSLIVYRFILGVIMRQFWFFCVMPLTVGAQTIERQPIDIIYGNQIIRTEHQVVVSSPEVVSVIPVERVKATLGPNVVIAADGSSLSSFEENSIAAREQAIFDEVNKRTEEAPFTVLFTGNIPEEIQERRLRMMPEIGVFRDQVGDDSADVVQPDVGDFSSVGKGGTPIGTSSKVEDEANLEALIGG
jgi:hypothetical protein